MTAPIPPSPQDIQKLTDSISTLSATMMEFKDSLSGGMADLQAALTGGGTGTTAAASSATMTAGLQSSVTNLQNQLTGLAANIGKSPLQTAMQGSQVFQLQNQLAQLAANIQATKNAIAAGASPAQVQAMLANNQAAVNGVTANFNAMKVSAASVEMALDGLTIVMKMAAEGIQQASRLSITAQEGVAMQFRNQISALSSVFTLDPNRIVSKEQLYAAQEGVMLALGGLREGFELDSKAIQGVISDMRSGLRSQIVPTVETFRTLAFLGIQPTIAEMDKLREATGRAALGQAQIDVLNRNRMALQIFGTQLSKLTLDFDRVGISMNSIIASGQSYVTNLEGSLDAIAQLNQLGSNIDFGQLTMLMEFNPEQAKQYLASQLTPEQMRSSSFRALVDQMPGINVDEVFKIKGMENLDSSIAANTTTQKNASVVTSALSSGLAWLTSTAGIVTSSFVGLIAQLGAMYLMTVRLTAAMQAAAAKIAAGGVAPTAGGTTPPPPTTAAPTMTKAQGAGTGAGVGLGVGLFSGMNVYQATGSIWKSVLSAIAPIIGGVLGGMLGAGLSALTAGTMAPVLVPLFSGIGAMAASAMVSGVMDDGISTPETGRTLTTSAGTFALNPQDTVVAGTNLLPSSPSASSPDLAPLMKKIDQLIDTMATATTTIEIDGVPKTVNRMQLVGVYTRDDTVRSL